MARLEMTSLGEVVVELAVDDFLGGLDDGRADLRVQPAQLHIGLGRRPLDHAQRADHRLGLLFPADLEVADAALGLGAPVAVGRNLDGAEGVGFGAGRGHRKDLQPGIVASV